MTCLVFTIILNEYGQGQMDLECVSLFAWGPGGMLQCGGYGTILVMGLGCKLGRSALQALAAGRGGHRHNG